jgi:hypothetical protein
LYPGNVFTWEVSSELFIHFRKQLGDDYSNEVILPLATGDQTASPVKPE